MQQLILEGAQPSKIAQGRPGRPYSRQLLPDASVIGQNFRGLGRWAD